MMLLSHSTADFSSLVFASSKAPVCFSKQGGLNTLGGHYETLEKDCPEISFLPYLGILVKKDQNQKKRLFGKKFLTPKNPYS